MEQRRYWTTRRIECPEGEGNPRVLLEWLADGGAGELIGVHCGSVRLRDLSGGDCRWTCWDTLAEGGPG